LFARNIRSETSLGQALTTTEGQYSIGYRRPSALNLVARAIDASGKTLAQSATVFAAAAEVDIDLTTATDGVIRTPSTFSTIEAALAVHLASTPLSDLKENKDAHELQFLASATGVPFKHAASRFIAHALGTKSKINEATLFGIFHQGIPPALSAALSSLPDGGIDEAFTGQVLSGVLAHSRAMLGQALSSAVNTNILPASYAATQDAELTLLDTLRAKSMAEAPYLRGKTSLNDLLAAGGVAEPVKTAFLQNYADHNGHLESTWEKLRATKDLVAEDLAMLDLTLSAGEALGGNVPLVKHTLSQISQKTLASVQNLALLDESDWIARITAVDPEAASISPVLPDDPAPQRITRFAKALSERFAAKHPTTKWAGKLSKSQTSSFAKTKDELVTLITASPTFTFKQSNIDHFVATNKVTLSAAALADAKTAQRLWRVCQDYDSMEALRSAGHHSALSVYSLGRAPFVAQMTTALGSESAAKMAYARAQMTSATALIAFGRYNLALNGTNVAALASPVPSPTLLTNLPDLQALFGSLDSFQCADCQSVLSPAAYLVDLLQYIGQIGATGFPVTTPATPANACQALFMRRPDIQYVALSCNNTNITIPYIDLVNEILEAAIAPPATPVTLIDTSGTSDERRAIPQNLSPEPYAHTASAAFPLTLPFDLAFARTTAYINALGTTRTAILSLFASNPPTAAQAAAIAGASLGINPEMQALINTSLFPTAPPNVTQEPWDRWGLAQNPSQVIDPKTRVPYVPNPSDWVAALSKVPFLLNRAGITLQELYQLLEVQWVNSYVTLSAGTTTTGTLQILSPDTDLMVFSGLDGAMLDRANRFLRLWAATGLQMWELDWALEAARFQPSTGAAMLPFVSGAIAVQSQLKLPFQEVLGFWAPLETRDVTNHLGDEDTVVPSTYIEVFRNPAVLLTGSSVFLALTKSDITTASSGPNIVTALPHGDQTGMHVMVVGSYGTADVSATFVITVTSPTSFTLNGFTGTGTWLAGGTATAALSGNPIFADPTAPTPEQNAISVALGLSATDISAIITASGAASTLSLATLGQLLNYQRLASSLSLDIPHLILWIALTGGKPFNGAPNYTLEFLRRLAVLQGTGLAVEDLNYLLRNKSPDQSSLALTSAQATAILQTVRDAVARLSGATAIPVTGASNAKPITITTALPNTLQTGAQIGISGVQGNTSANGNFTITVLNPISFTLQDASGNGVQGNGDWISGGTIGFLTSPADPLTIQTTIQTIFINALATATGTTANVVTPVILKTGVLPLAPTTIGLLIAQGSAVDPTQFPTLISAFTAVAKAAALFTALKPTEADFAFAMTNAVTFNWLDPSLLPLPPVTDPYSSFEALLRAIKLNRRQPALAPRLFDVLNQWLSLNGLPTDLLTAIAGLAPALNAGVNDVTAVATALGATVPKLPAQTGSLADTAMLTSIASALDVAARYRISGATLVQLAATAATADTADAAMATLQAQYPQSAWFSAIQPVEDVLRQNRRDALVGYLMSRGPALTVAGATNASPIAIFVAAPQYLQTGMQVSISGVLGNTAANGTFTITAVKPSMFTLNGSTGNGLWTGGGIVTAATPTPSPFVTSDDLFDYYLIDPEMAPCALTTRLLQPSLAIQQFVQQCFLNLTFSGVIVDMTNSNWNEWSWRQQYRLWQANREVFLYPENYVLPETRTDASSFFQDLENDLRQTNADADGAEAAIENYLRKLVNVSRLQVAAHYIETTSKQETVVHVFAHTSGTPWQWYTRRRTGLTPSTGSWSAWEPLNLDINSQHLVPVVWDQRLYLIWAVFKLIPEKQDPPPIPQANASGNYPPQPAPLKFWTIEFAMSELNAGVWQAKRTIENKVFVASEDDPLDFTFRASKDPSSFGLQINVYWKNYFYKNLPPFSAGNGLIATATLQMPDSPLSVVEATNVAPLNGDVDTTQEPSFSLISAGAMSGVLALAEPTQYQFSGQDLGYSYGTYLKYAAPSSPVNLNVLCATTSTGQLTSVTLLNTVTNPRIVIPQQEAVFDSADPCFLDDLTRSYLVQPLYYVSSAGYQELPNLVGATQWYTRYAFQTFYHPYARTFLRELETGGVPKLMARSLQLDPQGVRGWGTTFNFGSLYTPGVQVKTHYPGDNLPGNPDPGENGLDFAPGSSGAYSLYNWELFYHVPMFAASLLMQNQQYQDVMTWLQYIFNPMDSSGGSGTQRFWQMAPFNAMTQADWINQEVQNLLNTLAADEQLNISDDATTNSITAWMADPFDPHLIASLRISAYAKATVMKFLDNLIAWGDSYYSQYTAETVNQAEQLYILADLILGPKPDTLRPPSADQGGTGIATYSSLQKIDAFSNVLVNIENVIVAPEPPQAIVSGTIITPSLPALPANADTLLFCIPPNAQLLAYWDTVSQRLDNIRSCRNLQGVVQPLPLYAPPINPLLLVEEQANGGGISSATQVAPIYRFAVYLQKAIELTNDVRAYGSLILSALEKQDAETLTVLRANQELDIQTRMLDVKTAQVTEAQDQITALMKQKDVVNVRYEFYHTVEYTNAWEDTAMALQLSALGLNVGAQILDLASAPGFAVPGFTFGAAGFGGSPLSTVTLGGQQIGPSLAAYAGAFRALAGLLSEGGNLAATWGSYRRRKDEWTLQENIAIAENLQLDSQIAAANDRLAVANKELDIQNQQISNAQAVSTFLTSKYTNAQLYSWMVTQLTTVYTQAYQLAFSLALQAQNAYQYELGNYSDTFIQSGYWDSQHKGLTAGESLIFDLRRMEAQYLAGNARELELTKHVSFALTSPLQLVLLRETGQCDFTLDETLFDSDYPGHYFRRLRAVALTIPCVTGPYTGVNATLTQGSAIVRVQAPGSTGYQPWIFAAQPSDQPVVPSWTAAPGTSTIVTSHGQNDAGLFDVNLRDERWLPFEGRGAVSNWNLTLDPRDNNFDFSTITDVILHLRYTARGGGDANAVRKAILSQIETSRSILVSVRNTFGNAYYTFFNPPVASATEQTLTLPMPNVLFPYSNLGRGIKITGIAFYFALSVPAAENTISALFGVTGAGNPGPLSLAPSTLKAADGSDVAALTGSFGPSTLAAPQSFDLTLPASGTNVPAALATTVNGITRLDPSKVEDILLVINYSID
jgi:hypothetical protein